MDMEGEGEDVNMTHTVTDAHDSQIETELDDMKKRSKEMEDEAAALKEMQTKVQNDMSSLQGFCAPPDPAAGATSQANKEEVDSRSVFVGNVDYSCTPEEVQQHFQSCGTVNRVTIRTDKFGQPKGYAYVEFLEPEAVQEALLLNESELHGRQLKVKQSFKNFYLCPLFLQLNSFTVINFDSLFASFLYDLYFDQSFLIPLQVTVKRTNVPGMKQYQPWRANPIMPYRSRAPFIPPPYFYAPYGYRKFPRYRMPMRYGPYY
ncbi:hypothetical protein Pint_33279 [Pistacia integerrima]|uniref:Uncharacterized protein n=1 Tax=Pistacia integerrima TaxID=434235 RepID=A0ACC0X265_9ROSI|nr:hypothetical protein Pint_33279 [Pistacia integerrima]